jgi:hypothetical protein
LRRLLYDTVVRVIFSPEPGEPYTALNPDAGELAVFYSWGRWFAVWRDVAAEPAEGRRLPVTRLWQVVRLPSDPSAPDGIMLHEV